MPKAEEREIYRLWWEYLKRSDRYKSFLEKKGKSISYADALNAGLEEPLNFTTLIFGDVWTQSFEHWWEHEISNPMSRIKPDSAGKNPHIKDAWRECSMDISYAYNAVLAKNRELNEYELMEAFRRKMEILSEWGTVRIEFNLRAPMEELVKEFRRYISQKRKERKAREFAMKIKGIRGKPTKDKLRDELQRYLDVYDLSNEGLTIDEVIEKTGTPAQRESMRRKHASPMEQEDGSKTDAYDAATIERMYRRDLEKAKRILSNVEQGYFPGDYD